MLNKKILEAMCDSTRTLSKKNVVAENNDW